MVYELDCSDLLLDHPFSYSGTVDHDTSGIEELFVVPIVHCIRDVWNVVACIRFSSYIDFLILKAKGFDKVLEKAEELLCGVFF